MYIYEGAISCMPLSLINKHWDKKVAEIQPWSLTESFALALLFISPYNGPLFSHISGDNWEEAAALWDFSFEPILLLFNLSCHYILRSCLDWSLKRQNMLFTGCSHFNMPSPIPLASQGLSLSPNHLVKMKGETGFKYQCFVKKKKKKSKSLAGLDLL